MKHSSAPWKVFPTSGGLINEYRLWDKDENFHDEETTEEMWKGNAALMQASLPLYVVLKDLLHNLRHGNGSAAWTATIERGEELIKEIEGG